MKLWRGNRLDGEWEAPVEELAERFCQEDPYADSEWPLVRKLGVWMGDPEGLNSVVEATDFDELLGAVLAIRAEAFLRKRIHP